MTWQNIACFISTIIAVAVMGYIAWYSRNRRISVAGAGVYIWISLLVSLLCMIQGSAIGLLIIALGLYRSRFLGEPPVFDEKKHAARLLVLLFALVAGGIMTLGLLYYRNYENRSRAAVEQQLSSIAELKSSEIVQWRQERLRDVNVLQGNTVFATLVQRIFADSTDSDAYGHIQNWLETVKTVYKYDQIVLLDAQGNLRLSAPRSTSPVCGYVQRQAAEIIRSGSAVILDFHRDVPEDPIHLAVVVPVLEKGRPLGLVALLIDPATYLYPLISRWPTPSPTAETLLVRRDGDDVLFLNDLKFKKNTALHLREPLTNERMPAVMAALGREGMMEGIDYRGVPVAAALRIIPDSPWAIVARVDLSEVYAPQRAWLWMILVLMCALLAGAGLSILFYWRRLVDRFSREQLDAAELLRESEDKFSRAFQSAPYAITITDPQDGMFVDVNDAFYAITGFSRDEALGSSSISQDLWVNAEDCNHVVQELMSGRKVAGQEYRFKKKNGDVLTGLFSADIIELKTGKFILSSINDITKRITAQESLLVKNLVFDASIAANSIADLSGTITQSNDAFLRMWGYASRDEVVGRPLTDFIEHEEEASAIVTSLNTAGVWEGEYTARKRDASTFIAHGLATVVRDKKGTLIGYQSAVLDITESKRTEHELAKHREHLAELVEERTAEITKINIRLQEEIKERESANKELATFSYSVSHDLRAPLRAIDGFSKILEDEYGKLFDAEGLRLLAVVRKNTRNMGQLIDDLLAFSRLGRQEILYANIDMESLARSVSDELLATSAGRNMRITVGALPPANGDMPMIRQVFFNLLANAVKFTRTREPAVIEIGSMHEGGQHEYYVKDNGVGFDMHYVGKLFGVFQRLHNANEFEGTGVGLALTKSIIVKHGGSVRAEGHVNAGATFYFSLPIKGATDGSKPG